MGASYTRQSTYTDGDVIQSSHTNNEFDQLLAAFASGTGHTHDGTSAEGGPVTKLLGTGITIGDGTTGTDITVTFDGESNDGVLKWMEDEDYFEFSDDLLIASTEKIQFRDTAIYIQSSVDGQLDLVADTEIQIAATTIDINGAVALNGAITGATNITLSGELDAATLDISGSADIDGNLDVGGNLTVTGTTTFNGGTLTLGDSASDNVVFGADVDSSIIPDDDDTYDLGSSSQQWRNIFIDGTAEIDTLAINGTTVTSTAAELNILDGVTSTTAELNILDGVTSTTTELNIIDGDTSATSTTVVDADRVVFNDAGTMKQVAVTDLAAYFDDEITAMPNLVTTAATSVGALNSGSITSGFGTIDTGSSAITTTGLISGGSLDIDDVVINGSTIGHTDDTDLITVASGIATVAGEISVTTLDIGGTNVTSTAAELNILDGVTSTTAELNILDGVTSTAAELNILDGVTSTTAELNTLDGITAVVGELNALDLGSTAVGTAIASKAVILDSNKDYTGIRNLTLTGDLTIGGDDLTMATNTAGHILVADGTNFNPISVTDLSEISTVADGDILLAVDASGGGLKKVTRSTIVAGTGSSGDLANVVEDTSPQLGGNLDLNGADIVTTSNATLDLAPNGTGTVVVRGNTNSGAIVFNCESNSHGQKVFGQPHSAGVTNTLMLPAGADSTLVSLVSTDTLTNKTLTSPKVNEDVAVTSTATELNLLDGVTATTAELNILDGVTSTAAELNILDGVTSTAAELNALDGITAVVGELNALDIGSTAVGTAVASKAVILDSDKDYTGIRNFTITGNLSVGGTTTVVDTVTMNAQNAVVFEGATADAHETTLTIVDPTADRTINLPNQSGTIPVLAAASNTAITSTPAELNILDGVTSTAAELNILDGVTATAAEINLIDGGTSRGTTAVADGDGVLINDAGTMRMTTVDTLSTYMSGKSVGGSNIVTTGALNSGTITSGFGTIDTGSSTITTTGLISGGSLDIDNVLINGATIGHTDDTDLITVADGLVTVAGEISVTTLDIGGTNVTSTAAELNILDGVTSTAAELNALDGITAVVGELNALDLGSTAVGNAIASKAVILDSNKDFTGLRNVTLSGELDAGSLDISGNADIDGTLETDALSINGTAVTSTAAELNILDGVTSTAAELNILDGVTSTAAELNILDGVTATATELNLIDGVTATTAELNILDGVTSTAAELNILDGVTATATELNYLDLATLGTSAASKVVSSDANNVVTFTGGIVEDSVTISSSSNAATIDLRAGTNFLHDLTENVTYTFSNPGASGNLSVFSLKIIQGSSTRAITWPNSVDWAAATAPTLTATNDAVDIFVFMTIDGGTTYYGFTAGQAFG